MTTSYTPEPRPDDPSTPSANPAVGTPSTTGATAPAGGPGEPDAATGPDNDKTSDEASADTPEDDKKPEEDKAPEGDSAASNPDQTDSAAAESDEAVDTYTTTEPGFPIGELIAALVQPGISAATMLPMLAMSLPSTAMGLAGPLLGSLVSLLGQGAQQPPSAAGRKAPPPPPAAAPGLPQAEGKAAEAYRERDADTAEQENKVRENDAKTDEAVSRGNEVQAQARNNIATIAADLDLAARRTPADPEGQARLNEHIRQSLHSARSVVLRAESDYRQVATDLAQL